MKRSIITTNSRSFSIYLQELHCRIHYVFVRRVKVEGQTKQVLGFLSKYGTVDKEQELIVQQTLQECENNPGFMLPLSDTEALVCLRDDMFDTFQYKVSIFVHETYHAIHHLFQSLGLDLKDDEHISIVMGNLTEKILNHIIK